MKLLKHYYLVHIQFLGFRFHGWQKQPELRTVQGTIEEAINKLFLEKSVKVFGGSRTDSMVSAMHYALQLLVEKEEILDFEEFIKRLNFILPPDIKALKIEKVSKGFNIIQSPKLKEYHYYFSDGVEKLHPFCAPMMTHIYGELDLELMTDGIKKFMGTHNFKKYCFRPSPDKNFERTIDFASLEKNNNYQANFFPEKSYYLKFRGMGFIRHQVRYMAGALFRLGLHEITLEELEHSLLGLDAINIGFLAPASGLQLFAVEFDHF
jgi:tRNA pseudouridine38-40 synthase